MWREKLKRKNRSGSRIEREKTSEVESLPVIWNLTAQTSLYNLPSPKNTIWLQKKHLILAQFSEFFNYQKARTSFVFLLYLFATGDFIHLFSFKWITTFFFAWRFWLIFFLVFLICIRRLTWTFTFVLWNPHYNYKRQWWNSSPIQFDDCFKLLRNLPTCSIFLFPPLV